ncbi:MAG: phosphoenolpyruvate synthase [Chloroflexi bacterium]|nr:phosphoenolpyruvate synthase [Chloroflexota bacterium]
MQVITTPTAEIDTHLCLPLDAAGATLARTGGKGLNLMKLAQAGFPVPGGFIVTTGGYDAFVTGAGLAGWMAGEVAVIDTGDPDSLAALSDRIRTRFRESAVPPTLAETIRAAYASLGGPKVAVRSSATAEDLPDFSFAGQQDTFLNVLGDDALLAAVVECWSSLWTARAIGYRARNGIDQSAVSLAVVVQEMVQSEVSGVLFTANPLTGRRTETVIDATLGLGEALVAGLVQPDHYVTETATGRVIEKRLGAKATIIRGVDGGGTVTEAADARDRQALSDDAIAAVTALGKRVADFYASPQDIEWGYADGQLYLLQSRAITSLFPLPSLGDAVDLHLFFSFGAVQGMLDPLTPLGQDTICSAFSGGAQLFGVNMDYRHQKVLYVAGERLWVNLTGLVRNRVGRKLFLGAFGAIESGGAQTLRPYLTDPRLASQGGPTPVTIQRLRRLAGQVLPRLLVTLIQPERSRREMFERFDGLLVECHKRLTAAPTFSAQVELISQIVGTLFSIVLPQFMPRMIVGYGSLNLLLRMADLLSGQDSAFSRQNVLTITRGLPHNVTTEMDLALWQTAQAIRRDDAAAKALRTGDPQILADDYLREKLPAGLQQPLAGFLERYGMRGVGEIDLGRPRWRENPVQVIQTLQSYLSIDNPESAPDRVFQRGKEAAHNAIEELVATTERLRGPVAGWVVRRLAGWVRGLGGLRELPKFTIIRLMGMIRQALLAQGARLVAEGVLEQAGDLFFLHLDELQVLAMGAPGDWKGLIRRRRALYAQEIRRKPIPRLLLSDGTAIYEGLGADNGDGDGVIVGSPVSAGVVEGTVHVVFDPHGAQLQHGEILVCPGTDPAWTPLFLAAGGLVTEVGGMMTHGSVVAREYGIPAVVGVDRATERLHTGQRVRMDGGSGRIEVLGDMS